MLARMFLNFPEFGQANSFADLARMKQQMDALSDWFYPGGQKGIHAGARIFPLINLKEDKDGYYICAELPGLKAGDLDIQVQEKSLTISGERKIPSEEQQVKYHRSERESGRFSRALELPGEIAADRIEAKLENGLLIIHVPKSEAAKPKQISVH
jgi:HSP20 family protein